MTGMIARIVSSTLGIALCIGGIAGAQPAPLTVNQLKPGVYWVGGGSGANTGILIGRKEVVVIDAKMTAQSAKAMLEEVRKLTPNPVTLVILTHSDGDHVNGLAGFPPGLRIIAHPDTRGYMEETAALRPYLPNETASGQLLKLEGIRVELLHFGAAHTSGDLVVYLPEQKVAFVGDLLFIGREPLIHMHKRGTSLGVVHTLKRFLDLDAEAFVSGHAPPAGKTEVRALLNSIELKQAKVKALMEQGKPLDEIKRELGVAAAPSQARRRPGLVEVIYRDLGGKP